MALDPEARRAEGVAPLSAKYLKGSRGSNGAGVDLPTATYNNPGATPNLRGVEANTSFDRAASEGEIVITQTFGSEVPRGEVWHAPDDALGDVEGPETDDGWTSYDSAANNSTEPLWPQVGSFTKFGEKYPGTGDPDNDAG